MDFVWMRAVAVIAFVVGGTIIGMFIIWVLQAPLRRRERENTRTDEGNP